MEASYGTRSPDSPAGDRAVRRSPGGGAAVMAGCEAVALMALIIYVQSALLVAAGEALVAQLIELQRAWEGARG